MGRGGAGRGENGERGPGTGTRTGTETGTGTGQGWSAVTGESITSNGTEASLVIIIKTFGPVVIGNLIVLREILYMHFFPFFLFPFFW